MEKNVRGDEEELLRRGSSLNGVLGRSEFFRIPPLHRHIRDEVVAFLTWNYEYYMCLDSSSCCQRNYSSSFTGLLCSSITTLRNSVQFEEELLSTYPRRSCIEDDE